MSNTDAIIRQTKKWIIDVVIGCNFCPFAAREIKQNRVHYEVEMATDHQRCLETFLSACKRLGNDAGIETSFVILPRAVPGFAAYLDLVSLAERALKKNGYEGIYQVASFHPLYRFAGAPDDDAANFTNRSPYPMLHILREETIEKALDNFDEPERIPERNIRFAREKGLAYMKMLRDACMG